jgi:heme-degrading monooxygenase HmoA
VIVEHVWLHVTEGQTDAYEASLRQAIPIIESAPDCFGLEARRQIEDPTRYLLLIRWASVAAHMAFRETVLYDQWRALTLPFYSEPGQVTHFGEPLER